MKINIRLLYLYLFSFVGLIITVIGTIQVVDLGIKTTLFKEADLYTTPVQTKFDPNGKEIALTEEEKQSQRKIQIEEVNRNHQRQASSATAMIVIGLPLYLYHWRLIKKES